MRAGMLACPRCGCQYVVDRQGGEQVSWLGRQAPPTRRALGTFGLFGGLVLAAYGTALAALALRSGFSSFYLLLTLVQALLLVLVGMRVCLGSSGVMFREVQDLACSLCRTTWSLAAPPRSRYAADTVGTPPSRALPRQRSANRRSGSSALRAWENHIRRTVGPHEPPAEIARVVEVQRIDTVRLIARHGLTERAAGRGDGSAAVQTLLRLLDLDTGYLPAPTRDGLPRTMAHEVMAQLAELDDPAAVAPLIAFVRRQRRELQQAAPDADEPAARRVALAEDLLTAAATALARLGDPRGSGATRSAPRQSVQRDQDGTRVPREAEPAVADAGA